MNSRCILIHCEHQIEGPVNLNEASGKSSQEFLVKLGCQWSLLKEVHELFRLCMLLLIASCRTQLGTTCWKDSSSRRLAPACFLWLASFGSLRARRFAGGWLHRARRRLSQLPGRSFLSASGARCRLSQRLGRSFLSAQPGRQSPQILERFLGDRPIESKFFLRRQSSSWKGEGGKSL